MIGKYTVYQGDSTRVLPRLKTKVNLFLTSPPYLSKSDRLGYQDDSSEADYITMILRVAESCYQLATEDGIMIMNLAAFSHNPMLPEKVVMTIERKTKWILGKKLTWGKPGGFPVNGISSNAEYVYIFVREHEHFPRPSLHLERINQEVFHTFKNNDANHKIKYKKSFKHEATFPMELVRLLINTFAPQCHKHPGDFVVCDPFAGTGTTLAMSILMGLTAIGIDMNPEFVEWTQGRLKEISARGGLPPDEETDLLPPTGRSRNWERNGVYTPNGFEQKMKSYVGKWFDHENPGVPVRLPRALADLADYNKAGTSWIPVRRHASTGVDSDSDLDSTQEIQMEEDDDPDFDSDSTQEIQMEEEEDDEVDENNEEDDENDEVDENDEEEYEDDEDYEVDEEEDDENDEEDSPYEHATTGHVSKKKVKRRYNGAPGAYRKYHTGGYVIAAIKDPQSMGGIAIEAWKIDQAVEQYRGDRRLPDKLFFTAYKFTQEGNIFSPVSTKNGIARSFDTAHTHAAVILTACASLNENNTFQKTHIGPAHSKILISSQKAIHDRAFGPGCPYCKKMNRSFMGHISNEAYTKIKLIRRTLPRAHY
jgi:DNA modification methylase